MEAGQGNAPSKDELAEARVYTKAEIREALEAIAKRFSETRTAAMHVLLAMNALFRLPNAQELFDSELRAQARDLWLKVKATGLQLEDPPLLFGTDGVDGIAETRKSENGVTTPNRM